LSNHLSLAEQKKLPWCNCDFRATGTWGWCDSYEWCAGRKLAAQGIEAGTATTTEIGVVHESPVAESDAP
jgi:hypothetical protein